ncbi:MAG: tyrosinase family protein [Acetobacteraceae bacterium]|nr:tyrosinase family protein [Acetobacteraceae bacterium]
MRVPFLLAGTVLLLGAGAESAAAQGPQFVPAYPLYCMGPLTTGAPAGGQTTTPFTWASAGAGAANPGPGQCVWADRPARGSEILPGGGNAICDFSAAMKSVPAGTFVEIGVARDPLVNNCMHLARYIGAVSPPFSAQPFLSPFVRPSIASMSPTQVASLRHGIQVMMSRPASDPTSYRFQANIHGTTDAPTTPAETANWNQCEHGSFYFLSWHRMYLYFFDRILRAAAGDPNLVLPYWNWTDPAQRTLPVAFRQPADSSNPLFIASPGRPAALDAGTAFLDAGTVDDSVAFADVSFETGGMSGDGFGGQTTAPMQFASAYGDLELQPHNVVHSTLGGLMGNPLTAAQDPIFWLHHANIDRLWNRWLQQGGGRADPGDGAWLNTRFTFYDEAGHAVYLTGADIVDTVGQLNYRYDDDPVPQARITPRVLAQQAAAPQSGAQPAPVREQPAILAESAAPSGGPRITLAATPARVQVPLTEPTRAALRNLAREPARGVVLRIDDIRTEEPPSFYYLIFVDPPEGQTLDSRTPGFVGNLSLFSLIPHRMPGGRPMPTGDIFVDYNISPLLGRILERNPEAVSVVLVPHGLVDASGKPLPLPPQVAATVGSVRLMER